MSNNINNNNLNNNNLNTYSEEIGNINNFINEINNYYRNSSDASLNSNINMANAFFNIIMDLQSDITYNNNNENNENKIKIIEPSVLETFKTRKFSDIEDSKTCHITLLDFEENQNIMELSCKHIFDEESIRFWLNNKNNICPVCRREFPFIYKEN